MQPQLARRQSTQNRRKFLSQIDTDSEWRAIYEEELALHQGTEVKLDKALRDKAQMEKRYEKLQKKLREMEEKVKEQNNVIFRLGGKYVNRQTSRRVLPSATPAISSPADKSIRISDNEKALLLRIDTLEQQNKGLLKRNKTNNKLLLQMYRRQTQATLQIPDEDHDMDQKTDSNHLKPPVNRSLTESASVDSADLDDSETGLNSLSPAENKSRTSQKSLATPSESSKLFRIESTTRWDERRMSALEDDLKKQMAEMTAENPDIVSVAAAGWNYAKPKNDEDEKDRPSDDDIQFSTSMEELDDQQLLEIVADCPKEACQMLRLRFEELEGNYAKMKSEYTLVVDQLTTMQFNNQRLSKHLKKHEHNDCREIIPRSSYTIADDDEMLQLANEQ